MAQNRRERDRMRRSEAPVGERDAVLVELPQEIQHPGEVRRLSGLSGPGRPAVRDRWRAGALVLDAGCGNGLFGLWVLREVWQRQALDPGGRTADLRRAGPDATRPGRRAGQSSGLEAKTVKIARARAVPPPGLQYFLIDFDQLEEKPRQAARLPFQEGTFDVICCSLVLSYLKRPQGLLRELHRVLRPGGALIVSSMKPNCDLSIIYRDFIAANVTPDDVEAGRNLLRAAGKIKLKEENGYYTFYTQAELAELVMDLGFKCLNRTCRSGEQAKVIKAVK